MTSFQIIIGSSIFAVLLTTGMFCIRASLFNDDDFFQHRRVNGFDKLLGRTITRLLYFIIGGFFTLGSIGVVWQIVKTMGG